MKYQFRVGHWTGLLFLMSEDPDDNAYFKNFGLSAVYDEDEHSVYFLFTKNIKGGARIKGNHSIASYGSTNLGEGYKVLFETINLPKFLVHYIDVELISEELMLWKVPPFHELPWCRAYAGEEAFADLIIRFKSAYKDGICLYDFLKTIPEIIKDIMSVEQWKNCMEICDALER